MSARDGDADRNAPVGPGAPGQTRRLTGPPRRRTGENARRSADATRRRVQQAVKRPTHAEVVTDPGLQHERTSLAWERTSVSTMVSGVLLARYAAQTGHFFVGLVSLSVVIFGSGLLVWTALHYDDLHSLVRGGDTPVHPTAARVVGLATIAAIGLAFLIVGFVVIDGL